MSIVFKLTNAGRAALVNPPNTGTDPRTVVSLGVSATHTVIAPTLITLPGEIKRIAQVAGGVVAADMIHVTARDSGGDSYTVRAIGLYLDDGTLLGAYSQAAPIVEKSGESILLMSTDIQFQDGSLDLSNLIFGDTNFDNPPATTDRQGVVELATNLETSTGSDATRAVTPSSLKPLLDAKVDKATALTAGAGLTGGGDMSGNRTLAMGVPSNITSASANTASEGTHSHALDATGVAPGAYGGASAIPTFTVDAKGRVTQAGSIALTWGNLGGKPTTVAASGLTDAMTASWTITAGNGLTGGGSGAANRTVSLGAPSNITSSSGNTVAAETHTHALDATGVVPGAYGGASAIPTFTVDPKGRVTQAVNVPMDAVPLAHAGATGAAHGVATDAVAGFMSAADKAKLDGISPGAQVNAVISVAGRTGAVTLQVADVSGAAPLESAALTGNPTAPNPPTGTRSKALATMQKFADEFGASFGVSGYQKLPSGLIIQWGSSTGISNPVTFPVEFPNQLIALVGTCTDSGAGGTSEIWTYAAPTKTGFVSAPQNQNGTPVAYQAYWIALGF